MANTTIEPKRTSAKPVTIDGMTWECWHVGIMQTKWRSGEWYVYQRPYRCGWVASSATFLVGMRFGTRESAMKAVAKFVKQDEKMKARAIAR